jgi:signal transduction histidine kinase
MRTMYRQFTLTTVLIMIFSTVVAFFLTNAYYQLATKKVNDDKNIEVAQQIATYIEASPSMNLESYLATLGQIGYQLYVESESGYSQFIGSEFEDKALPQSAKLDVFDGRIYNGMEDFPSKTFMSGRFANKLENTVGVPFTHQAEHYGLFLRPHIDVLVTEIHIIFAAMIILMALISLLAMFFTAKQLIRPITQLTEATKQISLEKYDHLLKVNRKDEIGQLTESFNEMTKQLRANDQSRKEFISNVSHDFQSPLMNIQGYADLLKSVSITEEERLAYTSIIEVEAKRLSILTKQLLLLTSLDQSNHRLKYSQFPLDQQLKKLSQKYMWRIEEMDVELYYKITPIQFYGDESLLETVWDNLFTNALKYNKPHGSIRIELEEYEHHITIRFEDTGIGVQEDELPLVFERFYRADTSRTKEGTGLGLTIVKQIVELHGGSIHASSKIGEGTCFVITLPKA